MNKFLNFFCNIFHGFSTLVRFDCVSGKIIHRQTITLTHVEKELADRFSIDAQQLLKRLWNLLRTLAEFPPGEYLLQKDKKQLECINVYEKAENG